MDGATAPTDAMIQIRDQRPPDQAVDAAVDAGPDACAPGPELCGDRVDNDCDGQVDEGFELAAICATGLGPCRQMGLNVCSEDGLSVVCNATPLPSSDEVCDGVDNDCDGLVDNNLGVGEACTLTADLTPGCESVGVWACEPEGRGRYCDAEPVDADGDGYGCEDDCAPDDPTIHVGVDEICNGLDDDCDGMVDEDRQDCNCQASLRGGRRYLFCRTPNTWAGARQVCRDYRADLAVLNAEGEQRWALSQALAFTGVQLAWWMGLGDPEGDGTYGWINGVALAWDAWALLEPTRILDGQEAYVVADARFGGDWFALDPTQTNVFMCEDVCVPDDRDRDGFDACDADCDDTSSQINPGLGERCADGLDNDCDGLVDEGCN